MKPLNIREDDYPLHLQHFEGRWHLAGTMSAGKYFDIAAHYDLSVLRQLLKISNADLNRVVNHNPSIVLGE